MIRTQYKNMIVIYHEMGVLRSILRSNLSNRYFSCQQSYITYDYKISLNWETSKNPNLTIPENASDHLISI